MFGMMAPMAEAAKSIDAPRERRNKVVLAIACVIAWVIPSAQRHAYGVEESSTIVGVSEEVGNDILPRIFHKAVRLDDGRVLVVGGIGLTLLPLGLASLDDISVFDPATHEFSRYRTPDGNPIHLLLGRGSHSLTKLQDGRVLIAGGNVRAEGKWTGCESRAVEILSPDTGRIVKAPPMNEARAFHTATLLSDGRVLVAGGKSWQIFDPQVDTWSEPVRMIRTRMRHAAALLPGTDSSSDKVLVIGGLGSGGSRLEILDPLSRTSRELPVTLGAWLNDLAAARMADGRVLVVGGQHDFDLQTTSDAYVFNPADESLLRLDPLPDRPHGISDHEMITIGSRVFVFGGEQQVGRQDTELDYIAVFNSDTMHWEYVGTMEQPRDDFAAVRLQGDRILLIDGALSEMGYEAPTATAEIFHLRQVLLGDTDGNGRFTISDINRFVAALLDHENADEVALRAADINGDGALDSADVAEFVSRQAARPMPGNE